MSLDLELKSDLHEAFRLLYDDEDDFDAHWSDEETDPEASTTINTDQLVEDSGLRSAKYSKQRLQDMLEALIPSDPSSQPPQKRRRLLPSRPTAREPVSSDFDPSNHAFSPTSLTSYRNRLLSYTIRTYNSKPTRLQPQNVARYGWRNQGRERIYCDTCHAAWFMKGFDDPQLTRNPRVRKRMAEMFEEQLTQAHKKACPWRVQQSPVTIHRQLLAFHPLLSSRLAPLARELERDYVLGIGRPAVQSDTPIRASVEISHGLPEPELSNLFASLRSVSPQEPISIAEPSMNSSSIGPEAANMAFFGWQPYRPTASSSGSTSTLTEFPVPDVLVCSICDRKLGLSHFRVPGHTTTSGDTHKPAGKGKVLDVVLEHREFCPIRVYAAPCPESNEEDQIERGDAIDIDRPWWQSALLLRSEADSLRGSNTADVEGLQGHRLEKKEVLGRLRAILGEKQPRIDPRKHIRTVI